MSKIYDALRKSQAERRPPAEEALPPKTPELIAAPAPALARPEPTRIVPERDARVVELPSLDKHHKGFWQSMERVAAAVQSFGASARPASGATRSGRSILFAGVEPLAGATTVALFTSTLLVRDPGAEVLLIDCHARENGRGLLPKAPGVIQLALGEMSPAELIQATDRRGLSYMSRGLGSYNGPKLVERVAPHLAELQRRFDFLIIDAAPVTVAPETAQLAAICDGVVLVLTSERTARLEARRTREILEQHGATLVGTVMNRARRSSLFS